jgi:hypothetical protein
MARPRKKIDPEQVFKLARLGLSTEEIGDVLGCSHNLLNRRFASELTRARATFKMNLRRAQYIRAVRDRSDTMLIHMGKIYLDQRPGGDGENLNDILSSILAKHQEGEET